MANTKTHTRTKTKTDISYPNRFRVIIHNDDQTPMEFVIKLLIDVFNKNLEEAHDLTLKVHSEGKAIAAIYTAEIAEQKVSEALIIVSYNGYPLKITAEPI